MEEYRVCGQARLLDRSRRASRSHLYRPGTEAETLETPTAVTGDPVLRGFVLDLRRIW
jgi:hypothetical protein